MTAQSETGAEHPAHGSNNAPDFFGSSTQKKSPVTTGKDSAGEKSGATVPFYPRAINLPQVQAAWKSFLTLLQDSSRMLASQLSMAEIRSVKDNRLLLVFPASVEPSMQLVTRPDSLSLIAKALREHYKANLSVEFVVDPAKQKAHDEQPENGLDKADAREIVESSPRLQKILKLVDGEIVGVKKIE